MKTFTRNIVPFLLALSFLVGQQALAKSPLDGSINVVNHRATAVKISIDNQTIGSVGPRSVRLFKDIPNGRRLLTYRSRTSPSETRQIDVPITGRVSFTINKRTRRITLTNPNPRDMWLSVDGKQVRMIRAKRMTGIQLSLGNHVLSIRPAGSSTTSSVEQQIVVHPDANAMIQLPMYYAALTIKSPQFAGADILLDGTKKGRLHSGGSVTLTTVEPGRHRIELRRHRRILATAHLHFSAGQTHTWTPGKEVKANLKVINARKRAVQFQVNGRRPITVGAHSHTFVRNLPLGYHEITWRGPRGRERSEYVRVAAKNSSFTINPRRLSPRPAPPARRR